MKYIIRRIVALLVIATIIAVPAAFGAYSFERDKNDNHNSVGSESNTLSYSQVEPHVRTYIDEEKVKITTSGAIVADEEVGGDAPVDEEPATDVPVYDTPDSLPDVAIGTVLIYAGDKVPGGFLLCDGREVPRGKYQELYKVIGEKYGKGDGVTTFNLPDMHNLAARGGIGTVAAGVDAASLVALNERTIGIGGPGMLAGTMAAGANATGTIAAEYALAPLDAPAATARKISEPTGPPPTVDPSEFNRNDDEAKPESNPPKAGAAPTMYFIIKY
jgi:microcystin-dependent protein